MAWLTALLGILEGLLKAVPYFHRWFSKPTQDKIDEAKEDLDKDEEHFRRTGRPRR